MNKIKNIINIGVGILLAIALVFFGLTMMIIIANTASNVIVERELWEQCIKEGYNNVEIGTGTTIEMGYYKCYGKWENHTLNENKFIIHKIKGE